MIGVRKVAPDRSKIDVGEPAQLKGWSKSLKVAPRDIERAVGKVGNSAAAVRKELGVAGRR
jgi:predicted RNA-binding protein YlqC (UPF0109 family)